MLDTSVDQADKAFSDTVAHALRLHVKMQMLESQIKESLAVAGSIAGELGCNLSDPSVLIDAVVALRAQKPPGRGAVTGGVPERWMNRYAKWRVGTTHVLDRDDAADGAPWPGRFLPCAYMLTDATGAVIYVGKTTNLRSRIKAHSAKRWVRVTVCFCVDEAAALVLEGDLIYQHQPELNVNDRRNRRFVRPVS